MKRQKIEEKFICVLFGTISCVRNLPEPEQPSTLRLVRLLRGYIPHVKLIVHKWGHLLSMIVT